jgi:hypothetical protein
MENENDIKKKSYWYGIQNDRDVRYVSMTW